MKEWAKVHELLSGGLSDTDSPVARACDHVTSGALLKRFLGGLLRILGRREKVFLGFAGRPQSNERLAGQIGIYRNQAVSPWG